MQTDFHFPMEVVFNQNEPIQLPRTQREKDMLAEAKQLYAVTRSYTHIIRAVQCFIFLQCISTPICAGALPPPPCECALLEHQQIPLLMVFVSLSIEAAGGTNVFFDTSTSKSRKLECSLDVSTCITPSHAVYSVDMGRYLNVRELLSCQGIWRTDSENITAFDQMVGQEKMAHGIAGNAMTSTVAQCAFISCLVTVDAWRGACFDSPEKSANRDMESADLDHRPPPAKRRRGSDLAHRPAPEATDQRIVQHTEDGADESTEQPTLPLVPPFRLRKKTHLPLMVQVKKKKKRGTGPGNKRGKGKKPMPSIYEKEMIMQAYDKAVKDGEQKPIEKIKNMRGFFPGCVYQSKWAGQREAQQWPLLVRCCPKLIQKHKELPNSLRRMLQMQTMKRSMQATSCSKAETVHIPWPLQMCIEDLIMERILLGEEVTMSFAKSTLVFAVELWNESLTAVHEILKKKSLEYLHKGDAALADLEPAELELKLSAVMKHAHDMLKPIQLADNEEALM